MYYLVLFFWMVFLTYRFYALYFSKCAFWITFFQPIKAVAYTQSVIGSYHSSPFYVNRLGSTKEVRQVNRVYSVYHMPSHFAHISMQDYRIIEAAMTPAGTGYRSACTTMWKDDERGLKLLPKRPTTSSFYETISL